MNSQSTDEIKEKGANFAKIDQSAMEFISPIWRTIKIMVEAIDRLQEAEIRQVAEYAKLSQNTTTHYLKALVDSGFPIYFEAMEGEQGKPYVYWVDREKIKWLKKTIN
jgi:predicted transcriptional regulator